MRDTSAFAHFRTMGVAGKSLLAAFAVFFLSLQVISTAHATEYGQDEHTHNGQACLVSAVTARDDDVDVPSVAALYQPQSTVQARPIARLESAELALIDPAYPRGPPTLQ